MRLFTIFDSKTNAHMRPFCAETDESAVRAVEAPLGEDGHPFSRNPEDFSIFRCGYFNEETGQIVGEEAPVAVASLHTIQLAMYQRETRQMELLTGESPPVADLRKTTTGPAFWGKGEDN